MEQRLAILGAGGHGRVAADCARAAGWHDIAFYDDRQSGSVVGAWPLVGSSRDLLDAAAAGAIAGFLVAIGDNRVRMTWHRRLCDAGGSAAVIRHPACWISPDSRIGAGSLIVAGAVINIGADLGEGCIVNTGATIDHDCRLGAGVHVSPGANLAGGVHIGDEAWIGAGAVVRENVVIGARARVGAGAVVLREVAPGTTVAGCPATPIRPR